MLRLTFYQLSNYETTKNLLKLIMTKHTTTRKTTTAKVYTAKERKEFWKHDLNSHTGLPAAKDKPNYSGGESVMGFATNGEHHNVTGSPASKNY